MLSLFSFSFPCCSSAVSHAERRKVTGSDPEKGYRISVHIRSRLHFSVLQMWYGSDLYWKYDRWYSFHIPSGNKKCPSNIIPARKWYHRLSLVFWCLLEIPLLLPCCIHWWGKSLYWLTTVWALLMWCFKKWGVLSSVAVWRQLTNKTTIRSTNQISPCGRRHILRHEELSTRKINCLCRTCSTGNRFPQSTGTTTDARRHSHLYYCSVCTWLFTQKDRPPWREEQQDPNGFPNAQKQQRTMSLWL